MKLLFAVCCASVVAPHRTNRVVRWCACGESACWWEDGARGLFSCFNKHGYNLVQVLGLHNGLLEESLGSERWVRAEVIAKLLAETPDSYVFKKVNSLVIKFSPGSTGDTKYISSPLEVPDTWDVSEIKGGQVLSL